MWKPRAQPRSRRPLFERRQTKGKRKNWSQLMPVPIKVWIWVFTVGAAVSFLVWRGERGEGLESTKWPSVPGVMTESSVSETFDKDGTRNKRVIVEYKYA